MEIAESDATYMASDFWCETCADNNPHITCGACGIESPSDDSSHAVGRYSDSVDVCSECSNYNTFWCSHCEESYMLRYHDSVNVDGDTWCESCLANDAYLCENCGFDGHTDPENCRNYNNGTVHNYSFKPSPVFHYGSGELNVDDIPVFGIELESENITGSLNDVSNLFTSMFTENDVYLKEDGSLSYGFEIVTHPRSLASWREFAPTFASALTQASGLGQRAWSRDRCGLHIHVGRDNFTTSHAMRFALLFARNEQDWIRVANRKSSYASFSALSYGISLKVKRPSYANHSDAVNLGANNGATIEVRIFRPSLAVNRVIGCIELVDAGMAYTRNMTAYQAINGGLNFAKFAEFVIGSGQYPMATRIINNQRFTLEEGSNPCA